MLKVGITGGIGSGKSTICKVFEILGVPVFNADDAAKQLMNTDEHIKKGIQALFGNDIYHEGKLDRKKLASIVFQDKALLQKLNALVHPATIQHFVKWAEQYTNHPYVLKEAAIIFEAGTNAGLNKVITVSAPEATRIQRIMSRDDVSEMDVRSRIKNQMSEEERVSRADFVIVNDEEEAVIPQAMAIHRELVRLANAF